MPAPSPKASVSTRPVDTPVQPAIGRFCVTARTNRPSRVRWSRIQVTASTARQNPVITIRFQGRTALGRSGTPPDIQEGFATWTFCAPKVTRAAWMRMSESPQVARSDSSGRRYRWRMTVRSIATPTTNAAPNASGTAATTYQSWAPGRRVRKSTCTA